ncbi:MAG: cell envelope integrity protein CreD [Fibrobacterota bacterium]
MFDSLLQRFGGFFKIGFLAFLALVLLIPVQMVRSMVEERTDRANSVKREISSKWGGEQSVGAVRLDVPCTVKSTDTAGKVHESTVWIHAWPQKLDVVGKMETEIRKRGIYRVPLYLAGLDLHGEFRLPDPATLGLKGAVPRWEEAQIAADVGDIQSLARPAVLEVAGKAVELSPTGEGRAVVPARVEDQSEDDRVSNASSVSELEPTPRLGGAVHLEKAVVGGTIPFRLQVSTRGQGRLAIQPLARSTSVKLTSDWASPSYDGRFLPASHSESGNGFEATWMVSNLNLEVPMVWEGNWRVAAVPLLGVRMVEPVDDYDSSDRSLKYAFLFLTLTFLAFFLFETFLDTPMHPVQYALVGLANCLFYLLTLAISEHIGFDAAYWIAAGGTTLVISGYAASALSGWGRALFLGSGTQGLYGFLYTLLKAEEWSLLMGSCGLFAILAFVMWVTRNRFRGF